MTVILLIGVSIAILTGARAQAAPQPHHRHAVLLQLQVGLRGFPLRHHAGALEAAGHRYNVNPFLVAAIAGVESTFGKAACGGNAWGIASCGRSFASFTEGAWYTARLLRLHYLNSGLRSIYAIGRRYAADPGWAGKVTYYMRHFFRATPEVSYPR